MYLVKQKVELINDTGSFKAELGGRTCYNSVSQMKDDSWRNFLIQLLQNGHSSVLEHWDVYLRFDYKHFDFDFNSYEDLIKSPYSKFKYTEDFNGIKYQLLLYTNIRTVLDNNIELFEQIWNDDLPEYIKTFTPKVDDPHRRYTFKITTNNAITHELVRHRVSSFSQESTRYCNYSSDKYNGVGFVIPVWLEDILTEQNVDELSHTIYNTKDEYIAREAIEFVEDCLDCERRYLRRLKLASDMNSVKTHGLSSVNVARGVLNKDIRSQIIISDYLCNWIGKPISEDWIELNDRDIQIKIIKGFDTLRNSSASHLQIQELATNIHDILFDLGIDFSKFE